MLIFAAGKHAYANVFVNHSKVVYCMLYYYYIMDLLLPSQCGLMGYVWKQWKSVYRGLAKYAANKSLLVSTPLYM